MLHDLIRGLVSASANDPGVSTSLVVLDGNGVLADVFEPDKLKGAVAIAVNTLCLVLADDCVLQGSTGAKVEDGIFVVCKWIQSSVLWMVGALPVGCFNIPPSLSPPQAPLPRSKRCHWPS